MDQTKITGSMKIQFPRELPAKKVFEPGIRKAPDRGLNLNSHEIEIAPPI